jgi:hypothetical protein
MSAKVMQRESMAPNPVLQHPTAMGITVLDIDCSRPYRRMKTLGISDKRSGSTS